MKTTLLVLFVAAGCGDDGVHHLPDAPPPPDGSPDAAPQPVTLTVTVGSTPQAGVAVYFQNADSSLVSATMTDAAGVASAVVMPGAFVTAIDPFRARIGELRTFAGVKPGDQLRLDRRRTAGAESIVTFTGPPDANAVSYFLYTSCGRQDITGGNGPSGRVTLIDCAATADVVIESRDASGQPLNALVHADVPIVDGGTVDLVDLYQPTTTATFDYSNVPAGFTVLDVASVLVTPNGPLVDSSAFAVVAAGSATASVKRATVAGALAVNSTTLFSGGLGRHRVLEWGPPGPYALDANLLLPEYMTAPAFDAATHAVTWTAGAGASQPDLVVVGAQFGREVPSLSWSWLIAAPYGGAAVTFPVLPGDAIQFNPIETDFATISDLRSAKAPGGYDAARPDVLSLGSERDLVAGGTGRVVFEEYVGIAARRRGAPAPLR